MIQKTSTKERRDKMDKKINKLWKKIKEKFRRPRYSTDDIYEVLIKFVNQERNHSNLIESRWQETKEYNFKANEEISYLKQLLEEKDTEIEKLHMILKTQDLEIQKITKINNNQEEHQKKLDEYLNKVAEILKNNQKAIINRKKPTKADFIAEGMCKMDPSTKERLK